MHTGRVPTRHNLHDFFNGLMWFTQPRIKAALNTRQAVQIEALGIGPTRGGVRDALTLFDENACFSPAPTRLLPMRCAASTGRTLFVTERAAWDTRCEAWLFEHALLEKLVAPYKACTGHAWIIDVPADYFSLADAARCVLLDSRVAGRILTGPLDSRAFAPLPVLGMPGWWRPMHRPGFTTMRASSVPAARRADGGRW